MARTIGWISKCNVNDVPVGVSSGSIDDKGDTHDVTDTESNADGAGRPIRDREGGIGELELSLTLYSKDDEFPHATPINFRRNQRVPKIECWVNGRGGEPWTLLDVLLDDVKTEAFDPNQPNKISIHGYCSSYKYPGEA